MVKKHTYNEIKTSSSTLEEVRGEEGRREIVTLERARSGYFSMKRMENSDEESNFSHQGVEDQVEAFLESINTILDFNMIWLERKIFRSIYIAGI